MKITKRFVQCRVCVGGCEGHEWRWFDTPTTYEEAIAGIDEGDLTDGVRVVDKTFDDETFEITYKVIKKTIKHFRGRLEETIFEPEEEIN